MADRGKKENCRRGMAFKKECEGTMQTWQRPIPNILQEYGRKKRGKSSLLKKSSILGLNHHEWA